MLDRSGVLATLLERLPYVISCNTAAAVSCMWGCVQVCSSRRRTPFSEALVESAGGFATAVAAMPQLRLLNLAGSVALPALQALAAALAEADHRRAGWEPLEVAHSVPPDGEAATGLRRVAADLVPCGVRLVHINQARDPLAAHVVE